MPFNIDKQITFPLLEISIVKLQGFLCPWSIKARSIQIAFAHSMSTRQGDDVLIIEALGAARSQFCEAEIQATKGEKPNKDTPKKLVMKCLFGKNNRSFLKTAYVFSNSTFIFIQGCFLNQPLKRLGMKNLSKMINAFVSIGQASHLQNAACHTMQQSSCSQKMLAWYLLNTWSWYR